MATLDEIPYRKRTGYGASSDLEDARSRLCKMLQSLQDDAETTRPGFYDAELAAHLNKAVAVYLKKVNIDCPE